MAHPFKGQHKDGRDVARDRYDDGGRVRRKPSMLHRPAPSGPAYSGPSESLDFPPRSKDPGYIAEPNPAGADTQNSQFSAIPRKRPS